MQGQCLTQRKISWNCLKTKIRKHLRAKEKVLRSIHLKRLINGKNVIVAFHERTLLTLDDKYKTNLSKGISSESRTRKGFNKTHMRSSAGKTPVLRRSSHRYGRIKALPEKDYWKS